MTICRLCIIVATYFLASSDLYAQEYQSPVLYMAFLNYDAFHIQLIDRCATSFPQTVPALRSSIGRWNTSNRPALQELRLRIRDKTVREGMTETQANSKFSQLEENVSQFMGKQLASIPDSQLKPTCEGSYAEQLSSSAMNYVEFLDQAKPELNK